MDTNEKLYCQWLSKQFNEKAGGDKKSIRRRRALFLSLFTGIDASGNLCEFEFDGSSFEPRKRSLHEKVRRETNHAILTLSQGRIFRDTQRPPSPRKSHVRAICMLLGLRHYESQYLYRTYISSQNKEEKTEREKIIASLYDETAFEFEVEMQQEDGAQSKVITWRMPYVLLLVQAVRLSQWEWDNQLYCFEYFSALRAIRQLKKLIHYNQVKEGDGKKEHSNEAPPVLDTFARLIRWQTIEGQYRRESATFGIVHLNGLPLKATKEEIAHFEIEKQLLLAVSYADTFLKKNHSVNEKSVRRCLHGNRVQALLAPTLVPGEFDFEPFDAFEEPHEDKQREDNRSQNEYTIFSYHRLPVHEDMKRPEYEYLREKIKARVNNADSDRPENGSGEAKVVHYIINRRQRNRGVHDKVFKMVEDEKGGKDRYVEDLLKEMDVLAETELKNKEMTGSALPQEKVHFLAFHPAFVTQLLYVGDDAPERKPFPVKRELLPITFLQTAFRHVLDARERFDGKLPLPLVKRIVDLLKYYSYDKVNPNEDKKPAQDKVPVVFPVSIIFDDGTKELLIWLPVDFEQARDENEALVAPHSKEKLTVADVLLRYLNFLISNFGMTRGYRTVDIDFSAHPEFEIGLPMAWQTHRKESIAQLGLTVFERYLTNCGSGIIETTYAYYDYQTALDTRNKIEPFHFEQSRENDIKNKLNDTYKLGGGLNDTYVLGIDMGATGIRLQFFKITEKKPRKGYVLAVFKQDAPNEDSKTEPSRLYLDPEPVPDLDRDLTFALPSLDPEKAGKEGDEGKYRDAKEFAEYVVRTLIKKMHDELDKLDSNRTQTILDGTISIGYCWPGPLKQNKIASTSGFLRYFKGFSKQVMENEHANIVKLDVAGALREAYLKARKNETAFRDTSMQRTQADIFLTVALENDGDVEAAGWGFSKVNGIDVDEDDKKKFKALLEDYSVAVIKAGTGTAGSVLEKGKLSPGLNEFGKLIVDLGADNGVNLAKEKPKDRWPQGDANKFFSMNFIQAEAQKGGVPSRSKTEFTGLDLDLLLQIIDENVDVGDAPILQLFGALELKELGKPNIEWNELVEDVETDDDKKINIHFALKNDIQLEYSETHGYRITTLEEEAGRKKASDEIDRHTWYQLAQEERIAPLHLPSDTPESLQKLLERLGAHRIAYLNIQKIVDDERAFKKENKEGTIAQLGRNMGKRLADIVALLCDIYDLKAVIVAGGPMQSKKIGSACMEGFEEAIKIYLQDAFHVSGNLVSAFDKVELGMREEEKLEAYKDALKDAEPDEKERKRLEKEKEYELLVDRYKLLYHYGGMDNALLGAAVLGFSHYVRERKIKELQKLARKPWETKKNVMDHISFLTKEEGVRFMRAHAGRFNVTVDDEGEVDTLI